MKKIIILSSIVLSGFAFAQNDSDNPYVYKEDHSTEEKVGEFPGSPGEPAPIDQYIPALLLVAIGMTFLYAKRTKTAE